MNARIPKQLESIVVDIRETENLLLKRSRANLEVLKNVLKSNDELKRVPAVLSAYSIAGIVAGLFFNASINHGRLLSYHAETLSIFLKQLAGENSDQMKSLAALRYDEAGLLFPWLDNRIAEIQATLECFQEVQIRIAAPHLSFMNKITEVTRALSESPEGIATALRSYASAEAEQLFIWTVIDELLDCIDKYPGSLDKVRTCHSSAEDKMTTLMAEINAFLEAGKVPSTATTGGTQSGSSIEKFRASICAHGDHIDHVRSTIVRFDKSLQLMAKTLPPFIRTLSNLTMAWNKEANV